MKRKTQADLQAATVLSFLSQFGGGNHSDSTPPQSPTTVKTNGFHHFHQPQQKRSQSESYYNSNDNASVYNPATNSVASSPVIGSRPRNESDPRPHSRRNSLAHGYQPPLMDIDHDTPAELQPIFTYLNSHSNKLYQEGYFLKLHDLDSRETASDVSGISHSG